MKKLIMLFKLIFTSVNKPLIEVATIELRAKRADTNGDGKLSLVEIISELIRK